MNRARQEVVYETLRRWVETNGSAPGALVPTIETLASLSGAAKTTVQKVYRGLNRLGYLKGVRGQGTALVRPLPPVRPATAYRDPPSASPLQRLRGDILRGVFDSLPRLPVIKELTDRYGIGYRALRAALTRLCAEGLLERCQRGYRCPRAATTPKHRVFLVTIGNAEGIHDRSVNWRAELTRQLEYQCHRYGLQLEIFVFPFIEGRVRPNESFFSALSSPRRRALLSGTVVLPLNIPESLLVPVADAIRRADRPAAVLDEAGEQRYASLFAPPRVFTHFTMAGGPAPGEAMARYLLTAGHRRFAWISAQADARWAVDRRTGFERVVRCVEGTSVERAEVTEWSWREDARNEAGEVFGRVSTVLDSWARGRRTQPAMELSLKYDTLMRMNRFAAEAAMEGELEGRLRMLTEQKNITMWVAANDIVAAACLRFLRSRRLTVPETVSLAGFDDSDLASSYRISSYNYNCPALARAMVSRLVRHGRLRPAAAAVEVAGFVNSRETTRSLPRRESSADAYASLK